MVTWTGGTTIHDAWITGLTTQTKRRIGSAPETRDQILEDHRTWTTPISVANRSQHDLTVDLCAPENSKPWQLVYRLQHPA